MVNGHHFFPASPGIVHIDCAHKCTCRCSVHALVDRIAGARILPCNRTANAMYPHAPYKQRSTTRSLGGTATASCCERLSCSEQRPSVTCGCLPAQRPSLCGCDRSVLKPNERQDCGLGLCRHSPAVGLCIRHDARPREIMGVLAHPPASRCALRFGPLSIAYVSLVARETRGHNQAPLAIGSVSW